MLFARPHPMRFAILLLVAGCVSDSSNNKPDSGFDGSVSDVVLDVSGSNDASTDAVVDVDASTLCVLGSSMVGNCTLGP
jgi:hypothetical protein